MPTDFIPNPDERIMTRLRTFIDAAIDAQPEETREALRHRLDEHHGALRLSVERDDETSSWLVVAWVDEHRLVGVDARNVGLFIDDDGSASYRPDELLDDDLADDDDPASWFE